MAVFATVSDLRDTAAFSQVVSQSHEPVQVMKGRERKMVVMSNELFERYERFLKQLDFEAKIREAEADTEAGRIRPMVDVQRDIRSKYGL